MRNSFILYILLKVMTCIAVKKEKGFIHFCCESQTSMGWAKQSTTFRGDVVKNSCKIEEVGELYFGTSGPTEDNLVFKQYAKTHTPKGCRLSDIEEYILGYYKYAKDRNPSRTCDMSIILIYKTKVFTALDYLIYEVDKYDAIGSGMFYARATMFLGHDAKKAIEVANEFALGCGGNITEYKIPRKK